MKTFSEIRESAKDPCWKGYQMVGMKKKGNKEVPNCVPKESSEVDEKLKVSYKDTGSYSVVFRNKNGKVESEVRADSKEKAEKQAKIRNKKVKPSEGAWEVVKTANESVGSAAKKPQNFVSPDGKTRTRMVPAKQDIVKKDSEDHHESTSEYGKSQEKIRDKKKKDAISSSDKDKLVRLKKMMSKEGVEEPISESHVIHKNGKPMSIKGKPVTATSQDHANKIINKLKAHPFNKDHKFTSVKAGSSSGSTPPQKTNQPYKIRRNRSSMPAWRYAERGE